MRSRNGTSWAVVNATVAITNDFPVDLAVPPLMFDLLVPNCMPYEPLIEVAQATTRSFEIHPKTDIELDVDGVMEELPDVLTRTCPNSDSSPLDDLVAGYIHGEEMTAYVRGSASQPPHTPDWISEIVSSVTVPLPFPGRSFDHLMKNFSLADVHVKLPDPFADPDTPDAQPKVSAVVKAWVALPKQLNIPINVSRVRADADVFYHNKKLGRLDLSKWQDANSTRMNTTEEGGSTMLVQSPVKDAPLNITDSDVFSRLVQDLVFGDKSVPLHIKVKVDVEVGAVMGEFVIKDIPAEGDISVHRMFLIQQAFLWNLFKATLGILIHSQPSGTTLTPSSPMSAI